MAYREYVIGNYTGTGAVINVSIGFVPRRVEIVNWTDADEMFVFCGNGAGTNKTFILTGGTAVPAVQASNGISAYAGTANGVAAGFSVGTAVSENAKVYNYIAYR
jgi:hypothetical protein